MSINFGKRSTKQEMMDEAIADKDALFLNLRELEYINTLTGGPALGFAAIKTMLANRTTQAHIVDIGFGAGDMLVYLLKNAHLLPCPIKITAVDIMPETLEYVQHHHPEIIEKVTFEICDYRDWFAQNNTADVVHAGLFTHHLTDAQLVHFFGEIKQNVHVGAVINDLARAWPPYYFIKAATALFAKSDFTKNDAPLSVLRGFTKPELRAFLKEAHVSNYTLQWRWAYRYLLSIHCKP